MLIAQAIQLETQQSDRMRYIICLVLFFILFAKFETATAQRTMPGADKWLPFDFDPSIHTLLIDVENLSEKEVRFIVKWVKKKYPYKYRLLHESGSSLSIYDFQDKEKFRFVLSGSFYTVGRPPNDFIKCTYHFEDRLKEYIHPDVVAVGHPAFIIEKILKAIVKNNAKQLKEKSL